MADVAASQEQVCPVCGTRAVADALFCPRCTAPLAVVALSDLDAADRRQCLAALMQTLAETIDDGQAVDDVADAAQASLFDAYLSALWLRPETALIQYAEAVGLRRLRLPEGPWLDLGCGDGIHAALCAGWRFSGGFDAFQSLDLAARDVFDHFDPRAFAAPVIREGKRIALGIDIKPTAVARSKALGVFDRVEQADATHLPCKDGSIAVVFSNMLRDLGESLPAALDEVRRVLRDDGRAVLSAMTPAYRDALYFAPRAEAAATAGDRTAAERLLRLDRGRSVFCRQQLSPEQWDALLAAHGFVLEHVEPIVGPAAIRFWDVGLRPFAVPIIRQVDAWRAAGVLAQVKPPLLKVMRQSLEGLRRRVAAGTRCMHLLVVRKARR